MNWSLKVKRRAEKEIASISPKIRRQLLGRILALEKDRRPHDSIALKGEDDASRVDSGNYRILYHIDTQTREVTIFRVRHRKDVYRGL